MIITQVPKHVSVPLYPLLLLQPTILFHPQLYLRLLFSLSFSYTRSLSLSFSLFLLARYYLYVYFSLLLHLFFSFSLSPMTFFDRPSTANDDTVTTTMLSRSKNDTPEQQQQQHYQHDLSLETSQLMIRSPPEDNPEHQQPYKKFRQDPWSWDRLCSDANSPLATLPLDVGIE